MGKKRERKGKHLFLYGACLLVILLLSAGCATTDFQKRRQGQKHLDLAEQLISKGDYKGALKEDEEVVRLFPGVSPGDIALFHIGIIWAHPDNPQRNYKNALECFQRIVGDFPDSALKEEVRAWIVAINELILRESRIKDLEDTASALEKRLNAKIKDLEETESALKKQLNALKEIDLGIEGKKREDLDRE